MIVFCDLSWHTISDEKIIELNENVYNADSVHTLSSYRRHCFSPVPGLLTKNRRALPNFEYYPIDLPPLLLPYSFDRGLDFRCFGKNSGISSFFEAEITSLAAISKRLGSDQAPVQGIA